MRLRLIRDNPAGLGASASLFALGFLFALALSDAPRLHERFHQILGPDHECAVTMVLSGSFDHSAAVTPAAAPPFRDTRPAFIGQPIPVIESALDFSFLEHAPPFSA
jgi:hypothetical protein